MTGKEIPKESDESSEYDSDECSDAEIREENLTMNTDAIETNKRLIVVLDEATLEIIKLNKENQLLDCNKHESILKRKNRKPETARPDITHNALLKLMDSTLNRHGLLQVYVETKQHQLIEINPETRLPRTFDRFCGLFANLLKKLHVKSKTSEDFLIKVVNGKALDHLPKGTQIIRVDPSAEKVVHVQDLVRDDDTPVAIFVKASVCEKQVDNSFAEKVVAISNYPISVDFTCGMLTNAFARKWGIH